MNIADLGYDRFHREIGASTGLDLQIGPFVIHLNTDVALLVPLMYEMWRDYKLVPDAAIVDFHIRLIRGDWRRRWWRPQVQCSVDGRTPFQPLHANHHLPMLEWGINWCIARRSHHLLMLHSAVVERNGRAIILPAWPGHGKSTLCTALIHSGWRLLSDEFGLVRPEDGALLPLPRLIPLKNQSIEVIRSFAPAAHIGPSFYGTRKGTIAHVRPPTESVERMDETARPGWFVFPRWVADAPLRLEPMLKSEAFLMVATNAFNYEVLGQTAFELVARMVDDCDCYSLIYSDLPEAIAALDELTRASNV
ncbi:HprK-related kinase A [Thiocystis violascens]|uniref:Hpr(Ser) kinase/phosphatase n=1 Tax=Thiocystis violascens (strain ATCC 17096 / DSM 198 / 6111) TaxID=765911 RepID=I3YGH7_THIV6|nr:HprK-related kinase A [Thiocystis violascens]AFL76095.1 Hpr(Ser) kinase/phosphatase [Thiocystis violascens DSM 198]